LSAHPPLRLRLTLAFLLVVLAGTAVGAAVAFGSGQEAPTTLRTGPVAATGPPLALGGIDGNPAAAAAAGPSLRIGILDKSAAIRAQVARADAAALRELAAAQEAAIAAYAAAVDAATAPTGDPGGSSGGGGSTGGGDDGGSSGGGGGGTVGGSLSERLDALAQCESGGNPRAFNPAGPWYGAFQFHPDTWRNMGGGPGDIRNYSYGEQKAVAARLVAAAGWGQWPSCAARLGYI